ncbi:hypothetical protein E1269_30100, partial [Jiangella asiatica]
MSLPRLAAALLAGSLLLAGCGDADDPDAGSAADSAPETTTPPADPGPAPRIDVVADLAPADAGTVGAAVNAFGFDLLGQLTDGDDNTVTSPVSVAALLAMV